MSFRYPSDVAIPLGILYRHFLGSEAIALVVVDHGLVPILLDTILPVRLMVHRPLPCRLSNWLLSILVPGYLLLHCIPPMDR